MFNSLSGTASAFGITPQSVHYVCSGKCITCNNLYFLIMYLEPYN